MIISFILSIYSVDEKLEKTLNSIFQQKSKDYEVIIVDEESSNNTISKLNTYFQKYYKYIKIITSLNEITTSIGWNLALKHASGQYVLFLQSGYELNESFISDLKQDIYDHNSPHLLEFLVQYSNVYNHISTRRLKNNHLYKPLNDLEVFAFIHHSLFNKIFSRQLIISNNLFFRLTSRFDLLFIYSFLPLAQNLYSSNKVLLTIPIEPMLTFNSFDFLKQWSHIYNYYKKINLQIELKKELEFAFARFHLYTFLKIIKVTQNKMLIHKAIKEVIKKVERRAPNWINNSYIDLIDNDPFKEIVNKNWKKTLKALME